MDQFLVRKSAKRLEEVISRYSLDDAEVRALSYALSKMIADARAGKIVCPVEWRDVPGTYSFTEGGLRKYSDLEKAYAEFKIEVSGGESPFLRSLRSESGGKEEKGTDLFLSTLNSQVENKSVPFCLLMACEQCGGGLSVYREGSAQRVKCSQCGWSVVTTHIPEIKVDETQYEVRCRGDYQNKAHVKAVSEVTGRNFLSSRTTLQQDLALVFVGQAEKVLQVRNTLVIAGITCEITPDFRWV